MTYEIAKFTLIARVGSRLRWAFSVAALTLAACGGGGGGGDSPTPPPPAAYQAPGYSIFYPNRDKGEFFQSVQDSYRLQYRANSATSTGNYPIDFTFAAITKEYFCQYVANQNSNDVSTFKGKFFNKDTPPSANDPTVVTLPRVSAGENPSGVGMDFGQGHRFVYVSNFGDDSISRYSYNPATCQLTVLGKSPTLVSPSQVRVYGKYAVVASYGAKLQLYEVNLADGSLTAKGVPLPTGGHPYSLDSFSSDETTTFLVTTNETSSSISTFTLDNKLGVLQNYGADVSVGAGPQRIYTMSLPNGQIMIYVLNRAGKSITTLRYDSATKTFVRTGPDIATQNNPFVMDKNPALGDKYLYAFHDDINTVTAYEVNQETGALKALGSAL